jgi:hypothetical protein
MPSSVSFNPDEMVAKNKSGSEIMAIRKSLDTNGF